MSIEHITMSRNAGPKVMTIFYFPRYCPNFLLVHILMDFPLTSFWGILLFHIFTTFVVNLTSTNHMELRSPHTFPKHITWILWGWVYFQTFADSSTSDLSIISSYLLFFSFGTYLYMNTYIVTVNLHECVHCKYIVQAAACIFNFCVVFWETEDFNFV